MIFRGHFSFQGSISFYFIYYLIHDPSHDARHKYEKHSKLTGFSGKTHLKLTLDPPKNPPVPSFQYFQACTSSRKNNLALKNKNTQESFFMRIKSSWDLKNLGFLCQQNCFGGEKLVGLHTAFIKLLWKHINWQSTCWDLLIYTMISENQNT